MSEELILFNARVTDLSVLLKSLLEVGFDADTKTELKKLQQNLSFLSSIVRNRGTLNTGGHFEWVDSKIVRALKIGQFICLEHVNLCSSAILDRLNSVFETDGKLLLSEKGVESNNQSESVSRHKEFRAFLTMDPRNGEISRAMRNRCIELSLVGDTYSRDDLKALIYQNGIHDMHLVEWALNIHYRVQQLSEFHSFNVSHLTKFAFLINENRRLGATESKALFESAVAVYVRSSHIDLLGMGLSYYHERLTEEIRDEISKTPDKCQNVVNLKNLIVTADNLDSLALIRLQCEPLMITIQCLCSELDEQKVQLVLNAACEQFSSLQIDLNWKSTEYLLHMIYEMSSLNDLNAREQYIHVRIQEKLAEAKESFHLRLNNLLSLNQSLAQSIREMPMNASTTLRTVPWNQHIFPRLRNYSDEMPLLTKVDQLKLSAILLANVLFDKIEGDTTKVKQSHINAITYSKAVNAGTISNGVNIDLITFLYPLLDGIKSFTIHSIQHSGSITYQQYGALICAYFWANRLFEESKSKLFKEKSVDQTLIDKLALHFNWLLKHLTNLLNEIPDAAVHRKEVTQFRKILQKIANCNSVQRHPLNEMRKRFTKRLTEFMPFFEKSQIQLNEYETELTKQLQLPAKKWQSFEPAEYLQSLIHRYRIILSDAMFSYKHFLVANTDAQELQWLTAYHEVNDFESLKEILERMNQLPTSSASFYGLSTNTSLENVAEENAKFLKYLESVDGSTNQSHLAPLKLVVSVHPIMEYFALRAFNSILQKDVSSFKPNMDFFKGIRSLDVAVLNSIRTVGTNDYKVGELMWNWIQQKIDNDGIESVFATMPQSIYRKISSFMKMLDSRIQRFGYNSLALNHQYLLSNVENIKSEIMPVNSCALTVSAFLSLFNEYGKSQSIGLGNLEVWSSTLTSLSKLLWNNVETFQSRFEFEMTNIEYSKRCGRKLLAEIKYIQSLAEKANTRKSDIENEFVEVVQLLESKVSNEYTFDGSEQGRFQQFYTAALIQSLVAVLELHLMTFTPLVDPVEKNRLKKAYTAENQRHLTSLTSAYDFMKIIMSYDGLGDQIIEESFQSKQKEFTVLLEKYSEKCALRPETCVYAELVDQINFFLENGCRPKSQLKLITDIDSIFDRLNSGNSIAKHDLQNIDEIIKRIDWCTNTAESFERSTIARFGTYYRDFTAPLESSVLMLKNGFRCMKQCLTKTRDSVLMLRPGSNLHDTNESHSLSTVLASLIEFPNVRKQPHLMPSLVRVLDILDNKDVAHSL